jgi:hypothetical protein
VKLTFEEFRKFKLSKFMLTINVSRAQLESELSRIEAKAPCCECQGGQINDNGCR